MTHLRTYVALAATAVTLALCQNAFTQDDLDDLLADLEGTASSGESAKKSTDGSVAAEEEKSTPAAEAPAAEEVPATSEAPAAEQPAAKEEVAEAPAAEQPAAKEEVAEAPAPAQPADEGASASIGLMQAVAAETDVSADESSAPAKPVVAATESAAAEAKPVVAKPVKRAPRKDAELIDELVTYEKLRREAMDSQAMREIKAARASMVDREFTEAVRHYGIALKLLNDSPASKALKVECDQGVAEGLYRAAIEEDRIGRRARAVKLMTRAGDMRHPKARRQLEAWKTEVDPDKYKTDISEISHRRNESDYKERRARERQHLKRARQLLAQREIERALDECELVLVGDPYNQEAIRLRDSIQRKREVILKQEREVTREAMIADVDKAWRPVYAVNARDISNEKGGTVKEGPGPDGERTVEQTIIQRMKEMRLPAISFKPPATIIDAVEYFRGASKDFDRPEIPLDKRGFNFVLKTPEAVHMQAETAEESNDDFSDTAAAATPSGPLGVPVIPMITASDVSFYDALKLVCDSVDYKFTVQGPIVMVMHKDMSVAELVTRSFPVLSTFLEKMSTASEDMTSMQTSGFGGGSGRKAATEEEESQERDWKEFFSLLGVKWPEGSSIFYVKTVGRLFVKNTLDNLAEFENVLLSLNQQVTLVEIESRFVEVCQDDLNSLGFEWILNSNYSIGLNKHIGRALGVRGGGWGASSSTTTSSSSSSGGTIFGSSSSTGGGTTSGSSTISSSGSSSTSGSSSSSWSRRSGNRNIGVNSIDGSNYSTGQRYLSTVGNHISGESGSTNDQFMKLNAFLGSADLSMILHMLSQRSDTDLLSAPKVLTRPGEEAVMKVVTEYIYPTDYDVQLQSSSSGSSGNSGSSQSAILAVVEPQSFTMREVGVILQVTPTLTDDGNVVDLELNTQVVDEPTWKNYGMKIPFTGNASSLQSFAGIGDILTGLSSVLTTLGTGISEELKATFAEASVNAATKSLENLTSSGSENMTYYDAPMEQPFFHVRSVDSKVSVYPGATIVMGGLITEARKAMDDKIPYLGDIPFLGRFFRSHSEQTSKRNLLIFVTTRIVDGRGREMHSDGFELAEQADVKAAPDAAEN